MHIELTRRNGIPLPEQIARAFEDRIESGLMEPGERLPSVRDIARRLSVSLVTASKSFSLLEERGIVVCHQGRGCYVADRKPERRAPVLNPADPYRWQLAVPDYLSRAQLWNLYQNETARLQLHMSAVQKELLPSREIMRLVQGLMSEDHALLTAYGAFQGDERLRDVMARQLRRVGVRADAEDVLVTSGAQQGIDLVARTFVGPGDVVVMEAPTYNGAIDVFASRGARIVAVPVDKHGLDVSTLARACDRAKPKLIYTIPTFHNPTGATMPSTRRKQLYELAESIDCLIVEDDPYGDMYFYAPPPPPIKSFDATGHVVYIKSYSKLLAPGCRIAAVAASGTVLRRLVAAKTLADLGSPLLTQKAIYAFLSSSRFPAYTRSLRAILAARYELVVRLLRKHAPKDVVWQSAEGGLNLWLKLPAGVADDELYREAAQAGLALLPGSLCFATEAPRDRLRVCFSYMPEPLLEESVLLLCRLLREAKERRAADAAGRRP